MSKPPMTQHVAYAGALVISTVLYVWYAFIADVTIFESALPFVPEQAVSGRWWQWLSAHFVHSNFIHYLVNMIGLGLLWMLHGEYASAKSFVLNFVITAVGISVCIYLFSPSLTWYVGMSGVLHGVFAWGVMIDMHLKRKTGYLLFIGLVIKLVDEQFFLYIDFYGRAIEVGVAVDAHLYGAVIGAILGLISVVYRKRKNLD